MKSKQSIAEQICQYLEFKRSCGYQLEAQGKELMLFAKYAELTGHKGPLTTELAVRWARLPKDVDPIYWAIRYNTVRRFSQYRILFDPDTEILPKDLLGPSKRRLSPHIYSDKEIAALLQAAPNLSPTNGLNPRTYVTLFGLLVSTGLRISEALNLSCKNVDLKTGVLTIKETKFKKSRLVPVHPSALQALKRYSAFRHSYHPDEEPKMFFATEKGKPLNYNKVLYIFMKLSRRLGLRDAGKKPRIHDLRQYADTRIMPSSA